MIKKILLLLLALTLVFSMIACDKGESGGTEGNGDGGSQTGGEGSGAQGGGGTEPGGDEEVTEGPLVDWLPDASN